LYAEKFPNKIAKLVLFAAITVRNENTEIGKIEKAYETLTPGQRINSMKNLTPTGEECQLEQEMFAGWGKAWLQSDSLSFQNNSGTVKFPAGPSVDVQNLLHNKVYYNAENISVPVLIIRGEWDEYPNNADAGSLLTSLKKSPYKKYIVIKKGTHVMHLEKSRHQLYDETLRFLRNK
jgi:pimeloyl-ACP methyl ester carboxylesterase